MKTNKVRKLKLGLYILYWKDGGYSLASVGVDAAGNHWFAPCNWISGVPCFNWNMVAYVGRLVKEKE